MGDCFNCAGPATNRCTLILESDNILEDKLLCDPCLSDFRKVDWIEVQEESVLGGGDDTTDNN
jgi:hypothetical protein